MNNARLRPVVSNSRLRPVVLNFGKLRLASRDDHE